MPLRKAAAIIPPAGQNRQVFGEAAKAKAVASFQTTPVNPYSKAAKGMESDTQYLNAFRGVRLPDGTIFSLKTLTLSIFLDKLVQERKCNGIYSNKCFIVQSPCYYKNICFEFLSIF